MLCVAIAAVSVYIYTDKVIKKEYTATVSIYVTNRSADSQSGFISSSDLATSQRLVVTYINVLKSDYVLDPVAERLGRKGLNTEDEAIRHSIYENVDILFSGEIPPNPSELLGSQNMQKLLDRASKHYDYILVDLPPVGVVSDACVIANSMDGVLFLVRQNVTERDAVKQSIKQLELSGANLMGFVFNGAQSEGKSYSDRYRYSYEMVNSAPEKKRRIPQKERK